MGRSEVLPASTFPVPDVTTPAATTDPKSPGEFAKAVLAIVAKGLESEQSLDGLKADLDSIVAKYAGRVPTVIFKTVAARKMVYGWASVVTKDGAAVEDRQGDVMDMDNLREVVHDFMANRTGNTMHEPDASGDIAKTGEIVDSFVIDAEVAAAFGVNFGCEGWMVGYKVQDDAVWKRVESGELRSFSIEGEGIRTPLGR